MPMLNLRRLLMVGALSLGVPGLALVQARAEFGETLLERTQGLFDMAQHWPRTPPRALHLNGARIIVATGTSEQPLAVMLDHFQAKCRAESGGLHDAARSVFRPRDGRLPSLIDGVLRVEEEKRGLVACLALGQSPLSAMELAGRIDRFAETADLAELGGLRVVRLESVGDGTFFVAAWNDGPVSLATMFPAAGDSPGVDPAGVPRPEGAKRVLSAWQEGAPSGVNLYLSQTQRDLAFANYVGSLAWAGFKIQDSSSLLGGASMNAALFARGTETLVVHAQSDADGTMIAVLPMDMRKERRVLIPQER